ncbi:DUF2185 domain-containing protein [Flavobacterium sp. ANB]|uniref:DUF2185 domain-containing protein n=1 Tax=unclassified Flavobacterium TaxID=196869 RepID=UPI0012B6E58C|nr:MULTISPECIES: DUF2185 domain-containing protein [unclassified Flavobacterium]MBF4517348.1 DUF2185 domain-containing protein [Flavobacterium sp. ANB]MTD70725.1 DUF2185 domain-containing protein [Flavobacterium sp. LC2016-13]
MKFFKKTQIKNENNFDNFPPIGALLVSKMVVDQNMKPGFLYREKRTRPEDSGWRVFTGFESEEYNDNPDNIGIYNPSTILKIDPSLKDILLKGVGSVYEREKDDSDWYKVTDFEFEDDFITTHKLTGNWTFEINNLFERSIEKDGTLYYTTGDKSIRLIIWNSEENKEQLYEEYKQETDNRDETKSKTLDKFEFSDNEISKIGYLIEEHDEHRTYQVLFGFSIIDKEVLQATFYFDEKEYLDWAINTWKNIKLKE